jgi:hypothetical protein
VESERSFLRDAERFFSHLFPGVVGLHPSSFHRRVRKLRPFLEPLRRNVLSEMVGDPEDTAGRLDAALGFASQAGFSRLGLFWGSVGEVGFVERLRREAASHLCATNGIPLSYDELTPANVAEVSLAEELITEAALGDGVARRLLGDLAYNSKELKKALAEVGILLATERSERRVGVSQQVEIALSSLKRVFGLGETLAITLVGLATRIAAKICAYTYAFLLNRLLGRPQGKIKELWA